MAEEKTWSELTEVLKGIEAFAEVTPDDHKVACEAIRSLAKFNLDYSELVAMVTFAAKRARERAEKRAGESLPSPNVTKHTSGWVCVNCQAKDAEIAKLKEQLDSFRQIFAGERTEAHNLKAALTEAQAKAVQPGSIVYVPDGEPRHPKQGDLIKWQDGVRGLDGMWMGKSEQVYKRVQ